MKKLVLATLLTIPTITFAASEQDKLAKWNSDVGRVIRQDHTDKLAQTTYRELGVKDVRTSDDVSRVYPQIETKATKNGSSTRVVAEAVLDTSKEKVAKDWAKKLQKAAKFGTGVLGGAAVTIVDQLLEAIDYAMGEGGQVLKKITPDDPRHPSYQYYYYVNAKSTFGTPYKEFISLSQACNFYDGKRSGNAGIITYKEIQYRDETSSNCIYTASNLTGATVLVTVYRASNPQYNPTSQQPTSPASENDIKDAIKTKVLDKATTDTNARNLAKDLVKESYARIWDDNGNEIEIRNDISDKQKDILRSDNPSQDGHSTSTPSITSGTSGSGSSSGESESSTTGTTTTQNPDGQSYSSSVTTTTTTTTTTNNYNFELPEFCDWASIVCDWYEDFKQFVKGEESEDTQLDIPENELPQIDTDLTMAGECPPDRTFNIGLGSGTLTYTISYEYICRPLELAKPVLILVALFLSALIVGGIKE